MKFYIKLAIFFIILSATLVTASLMMNFWHPTHRLQYDKMGDYERYWFRKGAFSAIVTVDPYLKDGAPFPYNYNKFIDYVESVYFNNLRIPWKAH